MPKELSKTSRLYRLRNIVSKLKETIAEKRNELELVEEELEELEEECRAKTPPPPESEDEDDDDAN